MTDSKVVDLADWSYDPAMQNPQRLLEEFVAKMESGDIKPSRVMLIYEDETDNRLRIWRAGKGLLTKMHVVGFIEWAKGTVFGYCD